VNLREVLESFFLAATELARYLYVDLHEQVSFTSIRPRTAAAFDPKRLT
jgi:hypothetical protein